MKPECIYCDGVADICDTKAFNTESGVRYAVTMEPCIWWTTTFKICVAHEIDLNDIKPQELPNESAVDQDTEHPRD